MGSGRPGGNPNIKNFGFKKGDPRINRKGAPKKLPILKMLLEELLGHKDGEDITKSEMAEVIKAMIKRSKSRYGDAAAKELLERAFGKVKQDVKIEAESQIIFNETKTYLDGEGKVKPKKKSP